MQGIVSYYDAVFLEKREETGILNLWMLNDNVENIIIYYCKLACSTDF